MLRRTGGILRVDNGRRRAHCVCLRILHKHVGTERVRSGSSRIVCARAACNWGLPLPSRKIHSNVRSGFVHRRTGGFVRIDNWSDKRDAVCWRLLPVFDRTTELY
jgi:hypothetical protein